MGNPPKEDDGLDIPAAPEEDALDVILCPQCGHPNLEFRNHCRRCGGPLSGSANLIPGAHFFEWTATDAARRAAPENAKRRLGEVTILIFAFAAVSLALPRYAGYVMAAAAVLLLLLAVHAVTRRSVPGEAAGPEPHQEQAGHCPECGGILYDVDDLCRECGALVAGRPENKGQVG